MKFQKISNFIFEKTPKVTPFREGLTYIFKCSPSFRRAMALFFLRKGLREKHVEEITEEIIEWVGKESEYVLLDREFFSTSIVEMLENLDMKYIIHAVQNRKIKRKKSTNIKVCTFLIFFSLYSFILFISPSENSSFPFSSLFSFSHSPRATKLFRESYCFPFREANSH